MPTSRETIDPDALAAATLALDHQLGSEAQDQCGYLHRFSDGKVSLELEWVDPASLARAAVLAYLERVRRKTSLTTNK
jgi:hypothetical protein